MMGQKMINLLVLGLALLLVACAGSPTSEPAEIQVTRVVEERAGTTEEMGRNMPAAEEPTSGMPAPTPVPDTPHPDMHFEDYGVNPYLDSAEDNLSTFAIDVDTASYTVARRYVMGGELPPAEAIRVEEFVNYFEQGYANPDEIAFGIYADGAPSPFHEDGTRLLRVGIQGYQTPAEELPPLSLTFVIDVSGSMEMENRLGLVKESLRLLVERLRPEDTVAVVVYGTDARVLLNPTSGEDREAILRAIDSLQTEGATNAEAGLRLGYEMASRAFREGAINRVILCSDGVANVGTTGPEAILATIREQASRGITLTSIGVGMGNFNDVLMEQLANDGDGNYYYVDTLDEARRVFVDNMASTMQVIARNAKIQVEFNQEVVQRYRLIGYENRDVADEDFRNDAVDAGELGAGHNVAALYALHLHPGAEGRIATVNLRWQEPASGEVMEINGDFHSSDMAPTFEATSARYQLAVVVAQYAELLRGSPWAGNSSLQALSQAAQQIAARLPEDRKVAEFAELVRRASELRGQEEGSRPPSDPPGTTQRIGGLAVAPRPAASQAINLVRNGDFKDGLAQWELLHSSAVPDGWTAEVTFSEESQGRVLDLRHTLEDDYDRADARTGMIGVSQKVDQALTGYTALELEAEIQVVQHEALEDIDSADALPALPALQINLDYSDADGRPHRWSWDFVSTYPPPNASNYHLVREGHWQGFVSPDLLELEPRPAHIHEIRISSRGPASSIRIARVALLATR